MEPWFNIRTGETIGKIRNTIDDLLGNKVESKIERVNYGTSTLERYLGGEKKDLVGELYLPPGHESDVVHILFPAWATGGRWYRRTADHLARGYEHLHNGKTRSKKEAREKPGWITEKPLRPHPVFVPDFEGHGVSPGFGPIASTLDTFVPWGLPWTERYLRDARDAIAYVLDRFGENVKIVVLGHSNGANTAFNVRHQNIVARVCDALPVFLLDSQGKGSRARAHEIKEAVMMTDGALDPATYAPYNQYRVYRALPDDITKVSLTIEDWPLGPLAAHIDTFCDVPVDLLNAPRRTLMVEGYKDAFLRYVLEQDKTAVRQLKERRPGAFSLRHNLKMPKERREKEVEIAIEEEARADIKPRVIA